MIIPDIPISGIGDTKFFLSADLPTRNFTCKWKQGKCMSSLKEKKVGSLLEQLEGTSMFFAHLQPFFSGRNYIGDI